MGQRSIRSCRFITAYLRSMYILIHVSGRAAIVHVSGHCVTVGIRPAARVVLVLVAWQVGFQRAGNLMLSILGP